MHQAFCEGDSGQRDFVPLDTFSTGRHLLQQRSLMRKPGVDNTIRRISRANVFVIGLGLMLTVYGLHLGVAHASSFGTTASQTIIEKRTSREAARAGLDSQTVALYRKQFDVGLEEAQEDLATQGMGLGVADALRTRWGREVADVWFDNDTGVWVVTATPNVSRDEVAASFDEYNLSEFFRVETVPYSQAEFASAGDELTATLKSFRDVQVVSGFGHLTVHTNPWLSESDRASIHEAEQATEDRWTVPVEEIESESAARPTPQVTCAFPYCDTLLGGDRYGHLFNGTNWICTMAFPASYSGVTVVLTDGHCATDMGGSGTGVQSRRTPTSADTTVGDLYFGEVSNTRGDWGYIVPYSPPPSGFAPGLGRPWNGWWAWSSGGLGTPAYVWSTSIIGSGVFVCKDGSVGGSTCGTTQGLVGVNPGPMILINGMTGCGGDSGSGLRIGGDTAVGLHWGANVAPGSNCGSPSYATPLKYTYDTLRERGVNFFLLREY